MSENSFLHHSKQSAYPALLHIAELAKQAGAEHEKFVINALDMVQAFSYDYALVQKTVREMEQRLMPYIIRKELMRKSPSLEVSKGDIEIGKIANSREYFRLSLKQLSEGFLIAGRPGAGKSNLIKRIMMELKKHDGVRMLILDCKNEYKDLCGHESFSDLLVADAELVNPELSKGPHKDSFAWLQVTIDLLREAGFTLLAAHKRLLMKHAQKLIQEKNSIDFFELTDRLEELIENKFISLKERNTLEIPLDILKSIAQQFRLSRSGHIPLETFAKRDTVIRLHKLSHKHASFFARFLLYWIYCWKDFIGDKSHLLVVSDEAKRLNSREESSGVPYSRIIAGQGRFLNMDFIWADQYPSMLESYTSNVHTFVCFNQTGEEISYAAQYLGATEEQKHEIRNLQVGEAFVKVPTYPYPFKIAISKAPEFPPINENRLRELMEPEIARLKIVEAGGVESDQPVKAREPATAKKQKGVLQDWQDFLQGVYENPHLNISQLYERLDLSGRKGTKLKGDLLAEGMIEEQVINTNERKRPQKKLRLTEKGLEYLRQSRGFSGNG